MIVSLAWTLSACRDKNRKLNIKKERTSSTIDFLCKGLSKSNLSLKSNSATATRIRQAFSQLALIEEPQTLLIIKCWLHNLLNKIPARKVMTTEEESQIRRAHPCSSYLRIKCFKATKITLKISFQSDFLRLWQIGRARCLTTVSRWDLEEQLSCPIQKIQSSKASIMDQISIKFKVDRRPIMNRAVESKATIIRTL